MQTLIAEDLLLLLLDDESGRFTSANHRPALAGAVLAELAADGAIELDQRGGLWKRTTVSLDDAHVVADPLLRGFADRIGEKPRSPQDIVNRIGADVEEALCSRLADRGVLRRDQRMVLWVFPRDIWPAADSSHERQLRSELRAVLLAGADPRPRIGVLIALLAAMDQVHRIVDREGHSAREVRRRADEVAAGGWASTAVRDSIRAAQAAATTATMAAVSTTVISS